MAIITIGIDPGKTGAAAILIDGKFSAVMDWSPTHDMVKWFEYHILFCDIDMVALEKVGAGVFGSKFNPKTGKNVAMKMGSVSAFSFGENTGWWKGMLDTMKLPWREVRPQEWQKGLVPKKSGPNDKPSLTVARRMFPGAPLHLQKHHGRADAILMAYWAFNQLNVKG